jgi:hypothetical protein
MQTFADPSDDYLFFKFKQLQEAALLAQTEINAIPEDANVRDEANEIAFAISPVERLAQTLYLISPSTTAGTAIKEHVVAAWRDGGSLSDLLLPVA